MNCYVPDAFHKSTTKVRIFIKQRPIKSEKSLHLPLKMVRKKSEFSIFESEFISGSTAIPTLCVVSRIFTATYALFGYLF